MPKDNPISIGKLTVNQRQFITPGLKYVKGKPVSSNLPRTEDLLGYSSSELTQILKLFNIFGPWDSFVMRNMAYVQRVSNIAPNSVAMKVAMKELIDVNSNRALLGMTRRASENWSTLESISGDVEQDLIFICLDDDSSCESCLALEGEIKTYLEWQIEGGPGASTCQGGDLCRCSLLRID